MHRKTSSHSAACQPNWLRPLKCIYQTIFFLNAIADSPTEDEDKELSPYSLFIYQKRFVPSAPRRVIRRHTKTIHPLLLDHQNRRYGAVPDKVQSGQDVEATLTTQNRHPMLATPIKSVCNAVIAISTRR